MWRESPELPGGDDFEGRAAIEQFLEGFLEQWDEERLQVALPLDHPLASRKSSASSSLPGRRGPAASTEAMLAILDKQAQRLSRSKVAA